MKKILCALFTFSMLALFLPTGAHADKATDKLAAEFVVTIQKLIKEDNAKAIAKLILYPLNVMDEAVDVAQNEAEFIKNYDTIFTPYVKNCILEENEKGGPYQARDTYYIGGGDCVRAMERDGKMLISTIWYRVDPRKE